MSPTVKTICCLIAGIFLSAKGVQNSNTGKPLKIDYPDYYGHRIFIPENNPVTEEGVYLGRRLFYETALSAGNTISCATCHQQRLAFTDGKRFSRGTHGRLQPRNTMSLANLLWVRNLFWDGRVNTLEKQAAIPLTSEHEMGQSLDVSVMELKNNKIYPPLFKNAFGSEGITGETIVKALSQFERTLVSSNSPYDRYLQGKYTPTASELNGIALFYNNPNPAAKIRGADCSHCHGGPKTYSELFQNNGLDTLPRDAGREMITNDVQDRGRFRVVTLRNIALTGPYMHDGRFNTLSEVVSHYNEHISKSNTLSPFLAFNSNVLNGSSLSLTLKEQSDLVAFLNMLTDTAFITDKRFSNPF